MPQYHGHALPHYAIGHIPVYRFRSLGTAGDITVQIPVEILEARFLHRRGEGRHDAGIEVPDGVGAAAGEPHLPGLHTRLLLYNLLHSIQIVKKCLQAGIYAVIPVGLGAYADAVAPAVISFSTS